MRFRIALRKNATGEIRVFDDDFDSVSALEFMWRDGNYACDCNRHLYFERARDGFTEADEESVWVGASCGDGRYTVLYAECPNGACIPAHRLNDETLHINPPGS